ncbi:hypothetical protein CDIK_0246 [Cucumispora dikerogammari]|nr:hypothetical protein CDIK_0246 [Cucumispora dikerogammari]
MNKPIPTKTTINPEKNINLQEIRDFNDTNPLISSAFKSTYVSVSPLSLPVYCFTSGHVVTPSVVGAQSPTSMASSSVAASKDEPVPLTKSESSRRSQSYISDVSSNLARCFKCSAYINPYCEILSSSFKCSLCYSINHTDLHLTSNDSNANKQKYNKQFNVTLNKQSNLTSSNPALTYDFIETEADNKFVYKKPTRTVITFMFDIQNVEILLPAILSNKNLPVDGVYCVCIYGGNNLYFVKSVGGDVIQEDIIDGNSVDFNSGNIVSGAIKVPLPEGSETHPPIKQSYSGFKSTMKVSLDSQKKKTSNKSSIPMSASLSTSLLIISDIINPPLIEKSQIYLTIFQLHTINVATLITKLDTFHHTLSSTNVFTSLTLLFKYLNNSTIYCFSSSDSTHNNTTDNIEATLENSLLSLNFVLNKNMSYTKCISHLSNYSFKTGGTIHLYTKNNIIPTITNIVNNILNTVNNIFMRIRTPPEYKISESYFKRIEKEKGLICVNASLVNEYLDFSIIPNIDSINNINSSINNGIIQLAILYNKNTEKRLRIINILLPTNNTGALGSNNLLINTGLVNKNIRKLTGTEIFHFGCFHFLNLLTSFISNLTIEGSKINTNKNKDSDELNRISKNPEFSYLLKSLKNSFVFKPYNLLFKYYYFHKIISSGVYFKSRFIFPILIINDEIVNPTLSYLIDNISSNNKIKLCNKDNLNKDTVPDFILICADKMYIKMTVNKADINISENNIDPKIIEKINEIITEFMLENIKVVLNEGIDYEEIKGYLVG